MKRHLIFALFALFTMPAAAATVQQDFDAAQAKLDAQDFYGARNAFMTLLSRFPPNAKGAAVSVVRAKLGSALIATNEPEAAAPMLEAALPGLKATTPGEAELRAQARFDLGRAEEARGLLDVAAGHYRAALALAAFPPSSPGDIGIRASLARTLIWSDPDEARRQLNALLDLPPTQLGGDARALVLTLRGRVELNDGKPAWAKSWFTKAADATGGSTTRKVSVADVRIRGDLALANQALGDSEAVVKNLSFAGATGDVGLFLRKAVEYPLPACAPLTGLAPDATAIVEFGIGDDGRVSGVTPIYATRGIGAAATGRDEGPEVLFTRAVRDWYWRPADLKELEGFWRQAVRVQLRCFTQRPQEASIESRFAAEFADWHTKIGAAPMPALEDNDAKALVAITAELARREAAHGTTALQLLPALTALGGNSAASWEDRRAATQRWLIIAAPLSPPSDLVLAVRLADIGLAGLAPHNWVNHAAQARRYDADIQRQLEALLAEAEAGGRGDSRVTQLTRQSLANFLLSAKQPAAAKAQFNRIVATPESALPAGDPIRQQALLRLADEAARSGDRETAEQSLASTGLAPEQCALIDVKPQGVNNRIASETIPNLARRWSSSGMVRLGYDITAEGRPVNVRTIIASPPFIFNEAMEKAVESFRYKPVFRPNNTIGCSGYTQPVSVRVVG